MDEQQSICFASFGSVVLDEIHFPHQKPLIDVLGGSGAYATLGARLFSPPPLSRSLAWPIHVGNDFPQSITDLLQSWNIELAVKRSPESNSTRGLLEYQDTTFGPKKFKYTTPLLFAEEAKLQDSIVLTSKAFHYLATPEDLETRVSNLQTAREQMGILDRPLIVWEPSPLASKPENLQACLRAAKLVDVFSPNHLELAALFGMLYSNPFQKHECEVLAQKVLSSGVGPDGNGVILIRAGENGCLIHSRAMALEWIPPFYSAEFEQEQTSTVVDPTGAGNAFLGAYTVGYMKTGDIVEAACFGTVAASFALEQVGMPEMGIKTEAQKELWNGIDVFKRLSEYKARQKAGSKTLRQGS